MFLLFGILPGHWLVLRNQRHSNAANNTLELQIGLLLVLEASGVVWAVCSNEDFDLIRFMVWKQCAR